MFRFFIDRMFRSRKHTFINPRKRRRNPARVRLMANHLEDRTVPTLFNFLDTFAGASFSNDAVNSGGTGNSPSLVGLAVHNIAPTPRPVDSGTDVQLRGDGTPVPPPDLGAANPNQAADTRIVSLKYTAGPGQV